MSRSVSKKSIPERQSRDEGTARFRSFFSEKRVGWWRSSDPTRVARRNGGGGGRGAARSRPGSARHRGRSKVWDERAQPAASFPPRPRTPPPPIEPIGRRLPTLESADEDNPQDIAGTGRDPRRSRAVRSPGCRARVSIRAHVPSRDRARAAHGAAPAQGRRGGLERGARQRDGRHDGKDVVSPAGARTIGGTGASAGNALVSRGVGDEMRPAESRAARDVCAPREEPNRTNEREERNALSRAVVCALVAPCADGGGTSRRRPTFVRARSFSDDSRCRRQTSNFQKLL